MLVLFEVRSVPDWHGIGTNLVRTNPRITFVIVNFLWSQMVGMIFVRKIIHLSTNIFGSTHFNHIAAEFVISYESIVDSLVVLLFALLFELVGRCSIPCLLASSRNGVREVALSLCSSQEWKGGPSCT